MSATPVIETLPADPSIGATEGVIVTLEGISVITYTYVREDGSRYVVVEVDGDTEVSLYRNDAPVLHADDRV